MKVLLVYANTYDLLLPPPVGLSLMTEPLRRAGHEVNLVDLMKEKIPDSILSAALKAFNPDVVGFSLRNLDNQNYLEPEDFVSDYARWVGMANEFAPTIIGGSAVMTMPEELFMRVGATYAMVGQGDRAFSDFLKEFQNGVTNFETPGLMWRDGGRIRQITGILNGYLHGGTMDWSVIDLKRYKKSYMSYCVITKTGCPHNCLFCDAKVSFGESWAPREPGVILEDLRRNAMEYKLNRLNCHFIDAFFNEPLDWAKRLLEAIIQSEMKIIFSVIIEPTANIDRELARLLRRAGCGMATTLLGSMDDGMLQRMRRPFTSETANRAFLIFEEERIPCMPQFMLGGPGENRETVLTIFPHLKRWKPIMVDANYGIRILPKAGIRDVAMEEGVITENTNLLKPTFYLSEALKDDREWLDRQVKRLKRFRVGSITKWMDYMIRSMAVKYQ